MTSTWDYWLSAISHLKESEVVQFRGLWIGGQGHYFPQLVLSWNQEPWALVTRERSWKMFKKGRLDTTILMPMTYLNWMRETIWGWNRLYWGKRNGRREWLLNDLTKGHMKLRQQMDLPIGATEPIWRRLISHALKQPVVNHSKYQTATC